MAEQHTEEIRLNKYLALQLGVSRREADELIEKGTVRINGANVRLGAKFSTGDNVTVGGKSVDSTVDTQYLMLHKPVGYVSSRRAQGDNPTIYALLPQQYHALKSVGRLDRDSSGLLLLTNDGDFTYRMTHPKFHKAKTYHVGLSHKLEPLHQQMISDYGVRLEDGVSKFTIGRLDESDSDATAGRTRSSVPSSSGELFVITMYGGRNRQIRRTFLALGYTVTYLHRVRFDTFRLGNLRAGEYELLTLQKSPDQIALKPKDATHNNGVLPS